jgi:hypothetical protein
VGGGLFSWGKLPYADFVEPANIIVQIAAATAMEVSSGKSRGTPYRRGGGCLLSAGLFLGERSEVGLVGGYDLSLVRFLGVVLWRSAKKNIL